MIRNALIAHSPLWMRQRLVAFCNFNWANYLKQHKQQVLISISIGIASHIFLDAITHNNGAIANMSTLFYYKIPIGQFTMPVYQVLQLLTSLLGALYIWWFIIKIKKEEGMPKLERMQGYWLYSFAIAIIVLVLRFWLGHVNHVLEDAIIAVVGSVLYGIMGVSFYYSFSKNRNRGIKKSPGI